MQALDRVEHRGRLRIDKPVPELVSTSTWYSPTTIAPAVEVQDHNLGEHRSCPRSAG